MGEMQSMLEMYLGQNGGAAWIPSPVAGIMKNSRSSRTEKGQEVNGLGRKGDSEKS